MSENYIVINGKRAELTIVALVGNLDKKFKGYYSWIKRDNIDKFILRTKKLARCFGVYWSIPFDNNFFMTGEHHAGSKV